jgi:hypothetical protein
LLFAFWSFSLVLVICVLVLSLVLGICILMRSFGSGYLVLGAFLIDL